jgi:hypothetical protein
MSFNIWFAFQFINSYFVQYYRKQNFNFITKKLGKNPNYKDKTQQNFDSLDLTLPKGPNSRNWQYTLFFIPSYYL